jgi:tetratricopeptide (TPR) repeat protein
MTSTPAWLAASSRALVLAFLGLLLSTSSGSGIAASMTVNAAMDLFNKANHEYQEQKYAEARDTYQQIITAGIQSSDLFYNMGNACARLGKTGEAVLYYERARKLAPRDRDVATNLRRIAPPDNDSRHFALFVPFFWILDSLSLREWMAAFLALFVLAGIAGALCFAFPMRRHSVLSRRLFQTIGVASLVLGLFAGTKYYQSEYVVHAVVMKPRVSIFSGPGDKFSQTVSAPEGTRVRRLSFADPAWAKVMLTDGQYGFTEAGNLSPI